MAKVHKSYRLDAGVVADVEAYARDGSLSNSEAVERLLRAGLDDHANGGTDHAEAVTEPRGTDLQAVCNVLRQSNADLRQTVSTLVAQLTVKDEQIRRAHEIADHSQRLHMAEVAKALPPEGGTGVHSLRDRIASIFGRRAE